MSRGKYGEGRKSSGKARSTSSAYLINMQERGGGKRV